MKWSSWHRRRWERQMNAEFQVHLENRVADLMQDGFNRDEAEERARQDFGSLELAKDGCRDQRAFEPVDRFRRNLRHAFRSFSRSPGYCAAAITGFDVSKVGLSEAKRLAAAAGCSL